VISFDFFFIFDIVCVEFIAFFAYLEIFYHLFQKEVISFVPWAAPIGKYRRRAAKNYFYLKIMFLLHETMERKVLGARKTSSAAYVSGLGGLSFRRDVAF